MNRVQPDTQLPKTPYKVTYSARLSQTGTDAPTALILQNNIQEQNPTWAYEGVGWYSLTFDNALPTTYKLNAPNTGNSSAITANLQIGGSNVIWLLVKQRSDNTGTDNWQIINVEIELYLYGEGEIGSIKNIPVVTDYKQYIALLTQTGTNAPIATILQNTIGNIVWTRTEEGVYDGTLSGAFPSEKTFINNLFSFDGTGTSSINIVDGNGSPSAKTGQYSIYRGNDNIISIVTEDETGSKTELSTLIGTSKLAIEIKVYN